MDSINY